MTSFREGQEQLLVGCLFLVFVKITVAGTKATKQAALAVASQSSLSIAITFPYRMSTVVEKFVVVVKASLPTIASTITC